MTERIMINPVTRISGYMGIEVMIDNHKVVDAKIRGLMFRGFELMLKGRTPLDAIYYSERICGICSTAHAMASAKALEQALGVTASEQGRYMRDFMHGCEFLQNHLRHFYQFTVPDFVEMPVQYGSLFENPHADLRLPKEKNDLIAQHYFDSLNVSREAHEMIAVFGGKAPHNHGVFVGGTTNHATVDKIVELKTILSGVADFIEQKTIPDVGIIAQYYPEYYHNGAGPGNFLSYGCFDNYPSLGTLYIDPMTETGGQAKPLDLSKITEEIGHSWYTDRVDAYTPMETIPTDDMNKPDAYSFVKSAKFDNMTFECGPLARQWMSGEYRHGISTMDRTIARVFEAKKITEVLLTLLNNMELDVSSQEQYEIPQSAEGAGLIDTTRGSLGHWLKIDQQLLSFYQVITPSVWNLSSRANDGTPGTGEQALIGTVIQDEENPVELTRIIHSFDPCVSCATHVFYRDKEPKCFTVVP